MTDRLEPVMTTPASLRLFCVIAAFTACIAATMAAPVEVVACERAAIVVPLA